MTDLSHREAVEILQGAGLGDQVSKATNLADLTAIRTDKGDGKGISMEVHDALTRLFQVAAKAIVENPY